jgi:hypothetical protein
MKQVFPRTVLPLAFIEAFSAPVKFGETRDGGIYVAKEIAKEPWIHIQMNSSFENETRESFLGLNIEHKDTFRAILGGRPELAEMSDREEIFISSHTKIIVQIQMQTHRMPFLREGSAKLHSTQSIKALDYWMLELCLGEIVNRLRQAFPVSRKPTL